MLHTGDECKHGVNELHSTRGSRTDDVGKDSLFHRTSSFVDRAQPDTTRLLSAPVEEV